MLQLSFKRGVILIASLILISVSRSFACTGITLNAKDGSKIVARTCEWGSFVLPSDYVIVPRGYSQVGETPTGVNGHRFTSKYGYAGIACLDERFVVEGMNEKGLIAQLFYFPHYGNYEKYCQQNNSMTIADVQLIPWMLGRFETIAEMEKEIEKLHIVGYGHGFESVHWNIADRTGRQVVIEYYDGKPVIHENKVGIITNAPGFDWHMTNLNNYMNVFSGGVEERKVAEGVTLRSMGIGSAAMGLPGDLTPASRFVRAAFYKLTARPQKTGKEAVLQAFQILNNFDVPIGAEFRDDSKMPDFISATQWTAAQDQKGLKFYYRTQWNYTIRCIDLSVIDFSTVKFQSGPIDKTREHPIEYIRIH